MVGAASGDSDSRVRTRFRTLRSCSSFSGEGLIYVLNSEQWDVVTKGVQNPFPMTALKSGNSSCGPGQTLCAPVAVPPNTPGGHGKWSGLLQLG